MNGFDNVINAQDEKQTTAMTTTTENISEVIKKMYFGRVLIVIYLRKVNKVKSKSLSGSIVDQEKNALVTSRDGVKPNKQLFMC